MNQIIFKNFLEERREWYKKINKVYCPILNKYVIFNSKGFYHLRYDSHGKMRSVREQMYKIGLLPLVIPVIINASSIFKYKKEEYSRPLDKYFEIWQLKEIVGQQNTAVSVVLRRIGSGNITFLSVWKERNKISKKPS